MEYAEVAAAVRAFRDEREWSQFHNPKDLAMSISIEAGELLEVFQWSGKDLTVEQRRDAMEDELADVAIYCLFLADALGDDLPDLMMRKLKKNREKYPANCARGNAKKYTAFMSKK